MAIRLLDFGPGCFVVESGPSGGQSAGYPLGQRRRGHQAGRIRLLWWGTPLLPWWAVRTGVFAKRHVQ